MSSRPRLNLPNRLTLLRIAATPVVLLGLLSDTLVGQYLALVAFIGAALTDYYDGKIARERNLVTNFGRIMDPLADKVLLVTVLICFVQLGFSPAWMVVLIIAREFAITGLRVLAAAQGHVIEASPSGKHKTISQMTAIIIILVVNVVVSSLRAWAPPWEVALRSLGWVGEVLIVAAYHLPYWSMFVAAVLSLYSGIEYFMQNQGVWREPNR